MKRVDIEKAHEPYITLGEIARSSVFRGVGGVTTKTFNEEG